MSSAPEIMRGHTLGHVVDADGFPLYVGIYNGTVTIGDQFPYRLDPHQAEDFAQLFVRACLQVEGEARTLTGAQKAELKAAAGEIRRDGQDLNQEGHNRT